VQHAVKKIINPVIPISKLFHLVQLKAVKETKVTGEWEATSAVHLKKTYTIGDIILNRSQHMEPMIFNIPTGIVQEVNPIKVR